MDINNILTFTRKKDNTVRITCSEQNKENIYKLLHKLGYRVCKLDKLKMYYKREGDEITKVHFLTIGKTIESLLKDNRLENIPKDLDHINLCNWLIINQPIKKNKLLNFHLSETLTIDEVHNYKLKTDSAYSNKIEIQSILLKLDEWKFSSTIDDVGDIRKNAPLYYKEIGKNEYLIFSHFINKYKNGDAFDCWIRTFSAPINIGKSKSFELQEVRLGFQLERDFDLIRKYVV